VVVTATVTNATTATVNCPAGHPYATGGGFSTNTISGNNLEPRVSAPVGGSTTMPATGWTTTFNSTGSAITITVYAICSS
jgi:hypothetical protein